MESGVRHVSVSVFKTVSPSQENLSPSLLIEIWGLYILQTFWSTDTHTDSDSYVSLCNLPLEGRLCQWVVEALLMAGGTSMPVVSQWLKLSLSLFGSLRPGPGFSVYSYTTPPNLDTIPPLLSRAVLGRASKCGVICRGEVPKPLIQRPQDHNLSRCQFRDSASNTEHWRVLLTGEWKKGGGVAGV